VLCSQKENLQEEEAVQVQSEAGTSFFPMDALVEFQSVVARWLRGLAQLLSRQQTRKESGSMTEMWSCGLYLDPVSTIEPQKMGCPIIISLYFMLAQL